MATCNLNTLQTDACASGFISGADNEVIARAVELQELYEWTGETATLAELEAQAKANGFCSLASNEVISNAVELQLLCNISGGT
jgi:hypothetical protein